jgi:hypothetical protein
MVVELQTNNSGRPTRSQGKVPARLSQCHREAGYA